MWARFYWTSCWISFGSSYKVVPHSYLSWFTTTVTMVYGSYIYSYWSYKPTFKWGAPPCSHPPLVAAQEHPCRCVLAGVFADLPRERILWAGGGEIGRASANRGTAPGGWLILWPQIHRNSQDFPSKLRINQLIYLTRNHHCVVIHLAIPGFRNKAQAWIDDIMGAGPQQIKTACVVCIPNWFENVYTVYIYICIGTIVDGQKNGSRYGDGEREGEFDVYIYIYTVYIKKCGSQLTLTIKEISTYFCWYRMLRLCKEFQWEWNYKHEGTLMNVISVVLNSSF